MAKSVKNNKKQTSAGPLEWLYILEDRNMDEIYHLLLDETDYEVEYWEDAGVIEITLKEEGHLDLEQSEDDDVLWVTASSKGYEGCMNLMKEIEKICGGHFQVDE